MLKYLFSDLAASGIFFFYSWSN